MKYKAKKSEIMRYYDCYSIGYCELQNLLRFELPESYTCGVYGWNADIYSINGYAIVTGYRPFGRSVDYEVVRKYDRKAEKIMYKDKRYKTWEGKEKAVKKLLKEFMKAITTK